MGLPASILPSPPSDESRLPGSELPTCLSRNEPGDPGFNCLSYLPKIPALIVSKTRALASITGVKEWSLSTCLASQ
jgi:hypothetical protein